MASLRSHIRKEGCYVVQGDLVVAALGGLVKLFYKSGEGWSSRELRRRPIATCVRVTKEFGTFI